MRVHAVRRSIAILFAIALLVASSLWTSAFVPGSANYFINGSTHSLGIEVATANTAYTKTIPMAVGTRIGISGDYSALVSLVIKYPAGRTIRLHTDDLRRIMTASGLSHGVWWISDSGVQYISSRDANIEQRKLTGGKL